MVETHDIQVLDAFRHHNVGFLGHHETGIAPNLNGQSELLRLFVRERTDVKQDAVFHLRAVTEGLDNLVVGVTFPVDGGA